MPHGKRFVLMDGKMGCLKETRRTYDREERVGVRYINFLIIVIFNFTVASPPAYLTTFPLYNRPLCWLLMLYFDRWSNSLEALELCD